MLDLNKPLIFAATGHRAYYIGMSKEGRIVVETETGHLSSIHPQNSCLLENISEPTTKEEQKTCKWKHVMFGVYETECKEYHVGLGISKRTKLRFYPFCGYKIEEVK